MNEASDGSAVHVAASLSATYRERTDQEHKKAWGQFFTSPAIADFMASLFGDPRGDSIRLLDPGAGTGVLGLAAARSFLDRSANRVHLVAVEKEPGACAELRLALEQAQTTWQNRFSYELVADDFLNLAEHQAGFHYVIANPPYFKMSPQDLRGGDAPNAYARFMEVSLRLLDADGEACFIIPRSFAAGYYFRRFRQRFHASARLEHVHVFDSRRDAFRDDQVLQENIIVRYRKTKQSSKDIVVTCSRGERELDTSSRLVVPFDRVISREDRHGIVSLPTQPRDLAVMDIVEQWPNTLEKLGLDVSTGPVVPFRVTEHLRAQASEDTVPLLWLQHVHAGGVTWPLGPAFRKCEHLSRQAGPHVLVPNRTYVLLRRFSAKEDEQRIVSAPHLKESMPALWLGIENHVNFIHRPQGEMTTIEAEGLSALLNSPLVDAYFRISSGNTQVSATELRALPLPSTETLARLARREDDKTLID